MENFRTKKFNEIFPGFFKKSHKIFHVKFFRTTFFKFFSKKFQNSQNIQKRPNKWPKMTKNVRNGQKFLKMPQMGKKNCPKNGSKCPKISKNGNKRQKMPRIAKNGLKKAQNGQQSPKCPINAQKCPKWPKMVPEWPQNGPKMTNFENHKLTLSQNVLGAIGQPVWLAFCFQKYLGTKMVLLVKPR